MGVLPFGMYGFSISIYVVSIMICIGGIILGVGYALNEKKLKEFGKNEVFQSIINGVLVGSMLILFSSSGIVNTMLNSITSSENASSTCMPQMSGNTAMCFAYSYLVGTTPYHFMGKEGQSILTVTTNLLTDLFYVNAILGVIAGLKINAVIISFSFGSFINPILYEIQYAIKALSDVAISITIQSSVLIFAAISATTILLPLGLIMRTFYPIRKLGGFLIATGIGLYVIMPMTYVFDASLINNYPESITNSSLNFAVNSTSSIESMLESRLTSNSISLPNFESSLTRINSVFNNAIESLLRYVALLIMYAFVLPTFSLVLTGISIRELSGILGSESRIDLFRRI